MPSPAAAPELSGRGGWIGAGRPITMAGLRGRVVVVFFWNLADVASLRVIEELRRLDHIHAEELTVVGVHCPGPAAGAGHDAVVRAVARHRLTHPVLDDPDATTAAAFGVTGGPALVLVDQQGSVVGTRYGEGHGPSVGRAVAELLAADHRRPGPRQDPLPAPMPEPLAFPARVAASPDGRLLAIADTGHDRVLVATVDGLVLSVFTGYLQPSAVRFDGRRALICDTVAGRAVWSNGEVLADAMAWPWDLVDAGDGSWIVAEAGGHRLVRLRPGEIATRVAAGNGTRGRVDGPDLRAELDQPAGLARDREGVLFVDSGAGSLRRLHAGRRGGEVTTLADGLHHPRGVAARPDGELVYVADTLASALLAWDGGRLTALAVDGLCEPGGLDVLPDGRLVVADTANHRIVLVDPVDATLKPVVLDETWVHAGDGEPLVLSAGASGPVPVRLELVDETSGPPARVVVTARPPTLLAGGEAQVTGLPGGTEVVEVRAGQPGQGLLLVEVTARTWAGGHLVDRVQRWRRRLDVNES
ncbi:MAG: redoxin domain-containing protein [Acidimicrobiales bacterium]